MGNNNRLAALRRFAGLQVVVIDLLFVFCSRASSRRATGKEEEKAYIG